MRDLRRGAACARVEALGLYTDLHAASERRSPKSSAGARAPRGYLALLAALLEFLAELERIPRAMRALIVANVIRTTRGMAEVGGRAEGDAIVLHSEREVRDYCYVVAGIVGELLTELFLLDQPGLGSPCPVPP